MAKNKKAKSRPRSDIPYVERLRVNKLAGIAAHRDDAHLTELKIALGEQVHSCNLIQH